MVFAGAALPTGLLEGNKGQVLNQSIGVLIGWGLSAIVTLALLVLVDKAFGLRLSETDEHTGLDLSQHGEEGYELNA